MRIRTLGLMALAGGIGLGAVACDDGTTGPEAEPTVLMSVSPEGGASGVAADAPVVVTFDAAMDAHASEFAAVHEGGVTGPVVGGTWMMESGGTVMRFTPAAGWEPGTQYTIHLGGGMEDAGGHMVDLETHGGAMGGMWADGSMMDGGMMGGGGHPHTGEGWRGENGSYGMLFAFTTEVDGSASVSAALVAMEPEGGATGVDPTAPVVVTFDHAIDPAMTEYAALHEGDVTGPVMGGSWALSEDSTELVFTHDEPLKAGTGYTIHLGGGMTDAEGHHVDLETNGTHMGGEWATDSMMDGGMSGGMMGGADDHMGEGWDHPENGSHGMLFTFTTAG